MLTCTWGQQTGSDVVRFVVRTDADGVVRGAAHNLPFLSSITTRHRALYTQTHINMHINTLKNKGVQIVIDSDGMEQPTKNPL